MKSRAPTYVDHNSPGLKNTLLRDSMFRRTNPTDTAPEDTEEAQRLLCKIPYRYKTGDSVMIRTENKRHRWLLVKIVQSYGWWLLGNYIPIYVISFGNGALQNCQEDEIWTVSQVLNMRKTRIRVDSSRKYSQWDEEEVLEIELARKLKQWRRLKAGLINSSESQKLEGCKCVGGKCVHSSGNTSLGDGEANEGWEQVF
ncbi:hypothetical protein Clacol_003187 [Clathrus columnatus]|uniref:Uncharacterized protein n=1 Tax=Clathrus columnatus TaxID=1419009 RepID=A0AAV5A7I3_9AGAM|nr:hypothetical protein Clacol_003187 [Clathrus columnatus]